MAGPRTNSARTVSPYAGLTILRWLTSFFSSRFDTTVLICDHSKRTSNWLKQAKQKGKTIKQIGHKQLPDWCNIFAHSSTPFHPLLFLFCSHRDFWTIVVFWLWYLCILQALNILITHPQAARIFISDAAEQSVCHNTVTLFCYFFTATNKLTDVMCCCVAASTQKR